MPGGAADERRPGRTGAGCPSRRRAGSTQRSDLGVGQARRHLLGGAVDAAALLLRGVDAAGDLAAEQRVAVPAQDVDRFVVGRVGEPQVDVGDRALVEGRGEQQVGQEVLAAGSK